MNARTHSTCFGSLEEVFMSDQGCIIPLDALVLIFLDQSITVELRLFLDVLYKWPRFSLLEEVSAEVGHNHTCFVPTVTQLTQDAPVAITE